MTDKEQTMNTIVVARMKYLSDLITMADKDNQGNVMKVLQRIKATQIRKDKIDANANCPKISIGDLQDTLAFLKDETKASSSETFTKNVRSLKKTALMMFVVRNVEILLSENCTFCKTNTSFLPNEYTKDRCQMCEEQEKRWEEKVEGWEEEERGWEKKERSRVEEERDRVEEERDCEEDLREARYFSKMYLLLMYLLICTVLIIWFAFGYSMMEFEVIVPLFLPPFSYSFNDSIMSKFWKILYCPFPYFIRNSFVRKLLILATVHFGLSWVKKWIMEKKERKREEERMREVDRMKEEWEMIRSARKKRRSPLQPGNFNQH